MNKKDIVLAGLFPANNSFSSPVQIQKLFFLIDKNISTEIDGPYFNFQPYNYGPFDKEVYDVLKELTENGLVEINRSRSWKEYRLTSEGLDIGSNLFSQLPAKAKTYIENVTKFVHVLSFSQLISAIYIAYPEMRVNSVFHG